MLKPENKDARKIFARLEASRTWGSIIINTWSQLVTEDALENNFSPDACAKTPLSLQASCQFIFPSPILEAHTSMHLTVGKGHIAVGVGGLSRRLRPGCEVQCGGTLGQACFPGWCWWRRPSISFCSGAFVRASETRSFWRVAPKTLPHRYGVLYVVLEASGGARHEHQEHLVYRQARVRNRLGSFVKSGGLTKSIKGPNAGEMEPQLC